MFGKAIQVDIICVIVIWAKDRDPFIRARRTTIIGGAHFDAPPTSAETNAGNATLWQYFTNALQ